tara:strand:- start:28 stop:225 length:198 start_codon:yes stop_codon:yes gene_type:complete
VATIDHLLDVVHLEFNHGDNLKHFGLDKHIDFVGKWCEGMHLWFAAQDEKRRLRAEKGVSDEEDA